MRSDIEAILKVLNDENVRYLVVGGLAVVLHGHLRTTMDLDLVIHLEPENLRNALGALERLGYHPVAPVPILDFADPAKRERWIREKNMLVFSLWAPDRPLLKIDIFISEPFDFEETYRRAISLDLSRSGAMHLINRGSRAITFSPFEVGEWARHGLKGCHGTS